MRLLAWLVNRPEHRAEELQQEDYHQDQDQKILIHNHYMCHKRYYKRRHRNDQGDHQDQDHEQH